MARANIADLQRLEALAQKVEIQQATQERKFQQSGQLDKKSESSRKSQSPPSPRRPPVQSTKRKERYESGSESQQEEKDEKPGSPRAQRASKPGSPKAQRHTVHSAPHTPQGSSSPRASSSPRKTSPRLTDEASPDTETDAFPEDDLVSPRSVPSTARSSQARRSIVAATVQRWRQTAVGRQRFPATVNGRHDVKCRQRPAIETVIVNGRFPAGNFSARNFNN